MDSVGDAVVDMLCRNAIMMKEAADKSFFVPSYNERKDFKSLIGHVIIWPRA